jgi:glutathione peroxidase-family protein
MEKSVINGSETCEVYRYLRSNTDALYDPENDVVLEVPWNFTKFLVDCSTGQVVTFQIPRISPLQLRSDIEAILKKNSQPFVPSSMDFGGKSLT